MALGDLYKPKGLALETAREVLQVDNPYAVNVALGCDNACSYCYGPRAFHKKEWSVMRPALILLESTKSQDGIIHGFKHYHKQLDNLIKKDDYPEGLFVSFATDPLSPINYPLTSRLIEYMSNEDCNIPIALLSKSNILLRPKVWAINDMHGMTIVSLSELFHQAHEPLSIGPMERLALLEKAHDLGYRTWVSMEPYPVPDIIEQDLEFLLNEMHFVDFIIFGKWNYDPRASTKRAQEFYAKTVPQFIDYCKSHGIRYHVKSDTLKFIGGISQCQ